MKPMLLLSTSVVQILAAKALVREQQHRILRRQRHYTLSGAIVVLVQTLIRKDRRVSLSGNLRAIQAECVRIRHLQDIAGDMFLSVAREWESLPLDRNEEPLQLTPAFASLLHSIDAARRKPAKPALKESADPAAIPQQQLQF